jgi:hypothetical protein
MLAPLTSSARELLTHLDNIIRSTYKSYCRFLSWNQAADELRGRYAGASLRHKPL